MKRIELDDELPKFDHVDDIRTYGDWLYDMFINGNLTAAVKDMLDWSIYPEDFWSWYDNHGLAERNFYDHFDGAFWIALAQVYSIEERRRNEA